MAFKFLTGAAALAKKIKKVNKKPSNRKRKKAIDSYKDTDNRKKLYNPDKRIKFLGI